MPCGIGYLWRVARIAKCDLEVGKGCGGTRVCCALTCRSPLGATAAREAEGRSNDR